MARRLKPCGTYAAFQRHRRHQETPCQPCVEANTAYMRTYARGRAYRRARSRALERLAARYATAFETLFDEEFPRALAEVEEHATEDGAA